MTGAAFSVYLVSKATDVEISNPEGALAEYPVTERTTRLFCVRCGTPILNSNPTTYQGLLMLYLGCVDEPDRFSPTLEIFCESRLPWVPPNAATRAFQRTPGEA